MTDSGMTTETHSTLTMTTRDAQWLAALTSVGATLLNPMTTDHDVEHNLDALSALFVRYYSGTEGDALMQRIRALLPVETPLQFVNPDLTPTSGWLQ